MPRKNYSDDDFINAVKSSFGIREVLNKLGLRPTGGNYKVFHAKVRAFGLDISHFTGQGWSKGKQIDRPKRSLSEILVKNSPHKTTHSLKIRLLKEGIFQHQCYSCFNTTWKDSPIPLELEHINGINTDNRLENLTLLCPNCHALTDTYRGKNKKYKG